MLIPLPTLIRKYKLQIHGVIHVGAHIGQEHTVYSAAGVSDVLWIEGNPAVYERLVDSLGHIDGYRFENSLIGAENAASRCLNVSNNEQSSSILALGTHASSHPEVEYVDSVSVPMKTLDTLLFEQWREGSYVYRNLLNVDIQGAELEALKGATVTLGDVDYVYTEVNTDEVYVGCAQVEEIDAFLTDFKRVETKMTRYAWGDALYVRKSLLGGRR